MKNKDLMRCSLAGIVFMFAMSSPSAKEIVIAQVAPFGGPQAVSGRDFNLGALVAFEEFNSNGGLKGNTIRFISRDDGYRPADTLAHVKELLEKEKPVAFLGMWGAENVEAVLSKGLLEQSGAPVIGVRSGASSLRENPLLFHIRASYRDEMRRIYSQIKTMGSTRIAMVYEDQSFGQDALQEVQKLMTADNVKPVVIARQEKNILDVEATVKALATAEPQAIILVANPPVAAAIIKGLRVKNLNAFILASSTADAEQLQTQLGSVASGVAVAQGVPNPYKATQAIAMDFRRQINKLGIDATRANFASMEGYLAARVAIEGLRKSGAAKEFGRKDMVRGLQSLTRFDIGGYEVDFSNSKREGSRMVDLSMISAEGRIRQ
jgi:branched-chain amino acid transport system substrate-binding protein